MTPDERTLLLQVAEWVRNHCYLNDVGTADAMARMEQLIRKVEGSDADDDE